MTLAQADKTFVYCSEASPSSFNPQMAADGPSFNASSRMIYNRMTDFELGTTKVIASLAESWTVSKDNLTYIFKLRQKVPFHSMGDFKPTRDFNADDILFTFNRMRDTKHPYHKVNGGIYEYYTSMSMGDLIKDIVKVTDHEVRFVLTRPEAAFLSNLAMDFASILSKEYGDYLLTKKQPEQIDMQPVGTGPFVFKSYVKDNVIRYEAHKSYFEGPSKLDRVVFAITPDASVRFQKLKAGECHLIAEPAPQDIKSAERLNHVRVISMPGLNIGYLAMNTEKPPLNQLKVRQAIYQALNRTAYRDAIYLGEAKIAKNPIPPTIWSYNDKVKDLDYNVEEARQLLKQAGVSLPVKLELWTLPVSRPYNPNGKKMGEMMQADLAKVGIEAKLVTYDWPTYLAKARKGEHQLLQLGWTGDNGDPSNFLAVLLSCAGISGGSNYARWCNQSYDRLIDRASSTLSQKVRSDLYMQAQQIFRKDLPWVPVAHSVVHRALAKNVVGYKMSPLGTESFYRLDLK